MSLQDIFNTISEVTVVFASAGAIILGFSKFIGNIFANRYIERVKSDFEKEVVFHKAQLELLGSKATKLHEKRFEKIEELYKKLVTLEEKLKILTAKMKSVPFDKEQAEKQENERINQAGESFNSFHDFLRENRFFFPENTCIILDKLHQELWDSFYGYTTGIGYVEIDKKEAYKMKWASSNKVYEDLPPLIKQLENELRTLIEVEIK